MTHHGTEYAGLLVNQRTALMSALLLVSLVAAQPATGGTAEAANGVFGRFTRHIQTQIASDKIAFAKASGCTNWFYHREKRKPAPAEVQPIRLNLVIESPTPEDCLRWYPGGLESVRQDFNRTQTSLSVSLTFYEFALVVDRDDDGRYSGEELVDLFQSLALSYDPSDSPTVHAAALTERFDTWYRARNLESVMNGMGQLYDKGYRVTSADRVELDRVIQ
jgi:hypothetical protein